MLASRTELIITLETANDNGSFRFREELCSVWEILNNPERGTSGENSC
jgi:hypothetical protein